MLLAGILCSSTQARMSSGKKRGSPSGNLTHGIRSALASRITRERSISSDSATSVALSKTLAIPELSGVISVDISKWPFGFAVWATASIVMVFARLMLIVKRQPLRKRFGNPCLCDRFQNNEALIFVKSCQSLGFFACADFGIVPVNWLASSKYHPKRFHSGFISKTTFGASLHNSTTTPSVERTFQWSPSSKPESTTPSM